MRMKPIFIKLTRGGETILINLANVKNIENYNGAYFKFVDGDAFNVDQTIKEVETILNINNSIIY
jgi:hypothetical protein